MLSVLRTIRNLTNTLIIIIVCAVVCVCVCVSFYLSWQVLYAWELSEEMASL